VLAASRSGSVTVLELSRCMIRSSSHWDTVWVVVLVAIVAGVVDDPHRLMFLLWTLTRGRVAVYLRLFLCLSVVCLCQSLLSFSGLNCNGDDLKVTICVMVDELFLLLYRTWCYCSYCHCICKCLYFEIISFLPYNTVCNSHNASRYFVSWRLLTE